MMSNAAAVPPAEPVEKPTKATADDPISTQFYIFAGRNPRDGDLYVEAAKRVPNLGDLSPYIGDPPDMVEIATCWTFTDGRWEGFVSVRRGARWVL
jgi:hypothetical protein